MAIAMKKEKKIDMCSGPILKNILLFTIPLMLSSILQLLFNAADIIVVGRFAGDDCLAAVGANSSFINLLTNFFLGFSIGVNVLVAKFIGAGKEKDATHTVHTAIALSLISGIAMTVVGEVLARKILIIMDTPKEILDLSTTYLRIYFLGNTANMVYNFASAILRAVGDTKRPLYYLTFSGVVNVVLNLIFVILLGMDVDGVAYATVISQCISAVLVVRCLVKEQGCVKLNFSKIKIYKSKLLKIIQIGFPASLQGVLFSFSNVIIQTSINSFGPTVIAGNSAAANVESFVYVAMNAFHQGAITFTSQNFGAGKYKRITKVLITSMICVTVVGIVLGNLIADFGPPLLSLYTKSDLVVEAGMVRMNIICRTFVLCGVMDVMVGMIRGMGYSLMPMFVSLIGACGLRILWVFTFFQMERFHKIEILFYVYDISWFLTFIAHIISYIIVKRKYKEQRIGETS